MSRTAARFTQADVARALRAAEQVAPVRLQLSRKAGFDLQARSREVNGLAAVSVARPGPLANPFTVEDCRKAGFAGDDSEIARRCAEAFRVWIDTPNWRDNWDGPQSTAARARALACLPDLRGKNLACWCRPGAPCHADVLLEIFNR